MIDGIISMGDMKKVGAVGWKTILYFMVTHHDVDGRLVLASGCWTTTRPVPQPQRGCPGSSDEAKDSWQLLVPHQHVEGDYRTDICSNWSSPCCWRAPRLAAGEKLDRDIVTSAYAVVERLMEFVVS